MITEDPVEKSDSPKCQTLVDAGRKLFWKHGFRRVTIDEICREADVSKMTFYRCFENKTELAKTIFDKEVKKGMSSFNEIIKSDIPATEKLHKIISMKMEGTNDISQEFLADFYINPDLDLKKYVEEVTRKSWKEVIEGFRYAQDQGWFRRDFKPEFLFFIAQQIIPMCSDKELLKFYDKPQDLIMEFANFFTYGISPHD
jgi:AcrR family transcriptional regulator